MKESAQRVSAWCGETDAGCWLDAALASLRLEGFDIEELIEDAEEQIRAYVTDPDEPQPVIVTIKNPVFPMPADHAVVIVGIHELHSEGKRYEAVSYMDPLTGNIERDITGTFWTYWDFAGQRAFVIRP